MKLLLALLKGLYLWGFATWVYVAASVLNPSTAVFQFSDLSFYVPIHTNLVGVLGFIISFIAFVIHEAIKDEK